jgi:hypothetical protein
MEQEAGFKTTEEEQQFAALCVSKLLVQDLITFALQRTVPP